MEALQPTPDEVCGVIVSFRPGPELPVLLERLAPQVGGIVIVDNGSDQTDGLGELAARFGARLISNTRNHGVSRALNQGVAAATEACFTWILTMDQDTVAAPDMVEDLVRTHRSYPSPERVGVVAALSEREAPKQDPAQPYIEVPAAITAGSLFPVSAFELVGGFREDLFIDYVDTEWCLRLRERGLTIIQSCRPTMDHDIGTPEPRAFLGQTVHPSHHPPWRRYFMTRNRVVIWRAYRASEPKYVRLDQRQFVKELTKILLYERDRGAKLAAVVRGFSDGLRSRDGTLRTRAVTP